MQDQQRRQLPRVTDDAPAGLLGEISASGDRDPEVQLHQSPDRPRPARGEPQPLHDLRREGGGALFVSEEVELTILAESAGLGLAQVVQQQRPAEDEKLLAARQGPEV